NIGFDSESDDPNFLYREFYGWADNGFHFESPETIELEEIVSSDSSIIAKGTSMPHSDNNRPVEAMRLVVWLELDKDSKSKTQTDSLHYALHELSGGLYLNQNREVAGMPNLRSHTTPKSIGYQPFSALNVSLGYFFISQPFQPLSF